MRISLSNICTPEQGLSLVATQFGTTTTNNVLRFPPSIGEGEVTNVQLLEGFVCSCMHFRMNETVIIERAAMVGSDQIPIIFYSDHFNGEQTVRGNRLRVGQSTLYGVFMPSPLIETQWVIPGGVWFFFVNLLFDRSRLLSFTCREDSPYLKRLLETGEEFYLFEALTPEMERVMYELRLILGSKSFAKMSKLHSLGFRLFSIFQERVERRSIMDKPMPLNSDEVKRLFEARARIRAELPSAVPITTLAHGAGMCASKLQRSFKHVFGMTIRECTIADKMELARELLASGDFSISEAGARVGYVNLSHFSKAFRKQFGVNPKEYVSGFL
jgi:AraC-like DNA-binding protein